MSVHPVLSAGFPDIDADVVAVRGMIGGDPGLRTVEKRLHFRLLLNGHIEIACDVPARHHRT